MEPYDEHEGVSFSSPPVSHKQSMRVLNKARFPRCGACKTYANSYHTSEVIRINASKYIHVRHEDVCIVYTVYMYIYEYIHNPKVYLEISFFKE